MQLTSRNTIESAVAPGVRFTVRRLDSTQRAARDLQTMEARRRSRQLSREWIAIAPMKEDGLTFVDPNQDTQEVRTQREPLDEEYTLLLNSVLKPASVRAALISIVNLSIDGRIVTTAKDFLDSRGPGTDALFDEIWQACEEASGLTDEERKNLQPPTISSELAAGETTDSTATHVNV